MIDFFDALMATAPWAFLALLSLATVILFRGRMRK